MIRLRHLRYFAEPGAPKLRAAGWALVTLSRLRRKLNRDGLNVRVAAPPSASTSETRQVEAALRMRRATCLERSLILQRWLDTCGDPHDVVVGVAGAEGSVEAHAWIDTYDPESEGDDFQVLARVSPRS